MFVRYLRLYPSLRGSWMSNTRDDTGNTGKHQKTKRRLYIVLLELLSAWSVSSTHLFSLYFNDWLSVLVYFTNCCNASPDRCRVGRGMITATYLLHFRKISSDISLSDTHDLHCGRRIISPWLNLRLIIFTKVHTAASSFKKVQVLRSWV